MEWGGEEKEREEKGGKEEQSALLYVNWLSHWWLGRVMMTSSNTWTWCQHFYMCARTHTHTHTQYSHNHSPTHLHISIHIEKHASYSQHAYTHTHMHTYKNSLFHTLKRQGTVWKCDDASFSLAPLSIFPFPSCLFPCFSHPLFQAGRMMCICVCTAISVPEYSYVVLLWEIIHQYYIHICWQIS